MAVDITNLSKVLREAMKSGKCSIGAKESITGMKGAKALLYTRSVPERLGTKLRAEAKKYNVSLVQVPMTSASFAKIVGKPYRVSAMTLRSVSESDLKHLLK